MSRESVPSPHEIETRSLQLIEYSDKVYHSLAQTIEGQPRGRQILRLGMQAIAHVARELPIERTGDTLISLLHSNLHQGSITEADTAAWPRYNKYVTTLPSPSFDTSSWDTSLDHFSKLYADTMRRTIALDGSDETDANHVVHLAALAVPYALEYHTELDPSRVAIYCFIHDAVEAYAGDTATLGATTADLDKKDQLEEKAMEILKVNFRTPFPEFLGFIEDYEALKDNESRFVKTFDKLEPKFTYSHSKGINIRRDYKYTREQYESLSAAQRKNIRNSYGKDYEDVIQIHNYITSHFMDQIPWDEEIPA